MVTLRSVQVAMSSGITIHWYAHDMNHGRADQPCSQCGSYDVYLSVTPTGDRSGRKPLYDANGQCENGHMVIRFHNVMLERPPRPSKYAMAGPRD